jgi:hypothetical protein
MAVAITTFLSLGNTPGLAGQTDPHGANRSWLTKPRFHTTSGLASLLNFRLKSRAYPYEDKSKMDFRNCHALFSPFAEIAVSFHQAKQDF